MEDEAGEVAVIESRLLIGVGLDSSGYCCARVDPRVESAGVSSSSGKSEGHPKFKA
jgi:hypothetical protein